MPRKNRGYKRGEPFRDARLFVIACEGAKREKAYFEALVRENQRVKVRVLAPEKDNAGYSAPKWVLDRAALYVEEYGLAADDQLWLVMDTDAWREENLREIIGHCREAASWHIALSNPCFEVWLFQHLAGLPKVPAKTCNELKQGLNELISGGYKVELFLGHLEAAIQRAAENDGNPGHEFPGEMETKVYLLARAIRNFL
ncbi:MAG: RloB domain-containing protein [Lewinellaceae bacterium]|nr:RloB domain-containing protein [Lewinellaceae bacterium]